MKLVWIFATVLIVCLGSIAFADKRLPYTPCWCWRSDEHLFIKQKPVNVGSEYVSYGSYGSEPDWNNPQRMIPLDYRQAQGKRIFYQDCVWCHADSTPAGPSNRSNVSPDPPLMNDGATLNAENDASLHKIIAFGGSAVGKSAMMPPYGLSMKDEEIDDLIAYIRVIAVPEYHKPAGKRNWFGRSTH